MLSLSLAVACTIGLASLSLPVPAGVRLHPGLFPAALACIVIVCCCVSIVGRPAIAAAATMPPALRAVVATVAAMLIMAGATRAGGVFLATFASASIAAMGVAGVRWRRALLIGFCLAASISAGLALIGRQPLPILPAGPSPMGLLR